MMPSHTVVSNLVEKAKLIVKHYCYIVFSFYSLVCVLSCGSWLVRILPPALWAAPLAGWNEWHLLSSYETSSPVLSASVERQGLDAPQCNCLQTSACQQPCWNICICCFRRMPSFCSPSRQTRALPRLRHVVTNRNIWLFLSVSESSVLSKGSKPTAEAPNVRQSHQQMEKSDVLQGLI